MPTWVIWVISLLPSVLMGIHDNVEGNPSPFVNRRFALTMALFVVLALWCYGVLYLGRVFPHEGVTPLGMLGFFPAILAVTMLLYGLSSVVTRRGPL